MTRRTTAAPRADLIPAPPAVAVTLLGEFEVRLDGRRLETSGTAQRLIGFLALRAGRPVRRSVARGTLWPEVPDARAGASLRSAIWRCRTDGGRPVVQASSTHVWLDASVDLTAAARHAHEVLEWSASDLADVDAESELATFACDLLEGWHDEWVLLDRERFRQLRLHVLDRLGELLVDVGRLSDAVQVGLVSSAGEPLRESPHRLLVRAHLCQGNRAEALRVYKAYAELLADELRVRPSEAMERLIGAFPRQGR